MAVRRLRTLLLATMAAAAACGGDGGPSGPSPTAPRVTSVSPASGPASGGTAVTITGSNFTGPAIVTIGGVPATGVATVGPTSITAVTGARSAGAADVVVTIGGRSGRLPGGFTYVAGQPPVIRSVTAQGTRLREPPRFADLNEEITLSVTAQDADTPAAGLTYGWSAPVGSFTSTNGASARWRAPQSLAATPALVAITVTVSDGASQATGTVEVRVHDSKKEVGDMGRRFLTEFSKPQTNQDWRDIMRDFDFSGTVCPQPAEVEAEREQVIEHYTNFVMHDYEIGNASVTTNFGGVCAFRSRLGDACIAIPVFWDSTDNSRTPPVRATTRGTARLTATYSSLGSRWWLCSSHYEPSSTLDRTFYAIR